jgi:hypothetical protein
MTTPASGEQGYLQTVRKLERSFGARPNVPLGTWKYEFRARNLAAVEHRETTQTTSSSEIDQYPTLPTGEPLENPELSVGGDATSPKGSWPTIATTSTGQPTESFASSYRTQSTLPRELVDGGQLYATDVAFDPLAVAAATSPRGGRSKVSHNGKRRPVGPVMRLFQEGLGRKTRAKPDLTKFLANRSVVQLGNGFDQTQQFWEQKPAWDSINREEITGSTWNVGVLPTTSRKMSTLAKKLHARVRSEKDLRPDPKRRVKAWLKRVELNTTPIPLDAEGLPVYS